MHFNWNFTVWSAVEKKLLSLQQNAVICAVQIHFMCGSKTGFSPMHKKGNEPCIIYPLINGSVLITFTVRVTK